MFLIIVESNPGFLYFLLHDTLCLVEITRATTQPIKFKTNARANRELINCAFLRFKQLASILVRVLAAPCVQIGHGFYNI